MISIIAKPYSIIREEFGEPGDQGHFVSKDFPFEMRSGNTVFKEFYGHKYIADSVCDALKEVLDLYGIDDIIKYGLNEWAGCYNLRKTKDGNWYSVHSWALAFDYLPSYGPYKKQARTPALIVDAFEKRGFIWGGRWKTLPDGMHFSAIVEGK